LAELALGLTPERPPRRTSGGSTWLSTCSAGTSSVPRACWSAWRTGAGDLSAPCWCWPRSTTGAGKSAAVLPAELWPPRPVDSCAVVARRRLPCTPLR
jgi:hypothetical protein